MTNRNRNLDIDVAWLLDLDVPGEVPCLPGYDSADHWNVSYDGSGAMQPVYLRHCSCADPLDDEIRFLGHVASCFEVVPFYHEHDALARQALEQICDKLQLNVKLRRDSKWSVSLYSKRNGRRVVFELDKSFSLAICKALAKLRSKE